jgi:hypothetical protein
LRKLLVLLNTNAENVTRGKGTGVYKREAGREDRKKEVKEVARRQLQEFSPEEYLV